MSASPTGLSPSLTDLSRSFGSPVVICRRSSTPSVRRPSVWPLPSSLATTKGIEFSFFSSGYLDVSLPRVPPVQLLIHSTVTGHYPSRVSPFGYLRINAYLRLPEAFRSLSRPSSAISALASTLRSCSLDLASSMQTYCLLRLVGTVCSQSLFCLFLCSFQGASSAAPALRAVAATRVEHLRFRQPLVGLSPSLDRVYTPADS